MEVNYSAKCMDCLREFRPRETIYYDWNRLIHICIECAVLKLNKEEDQ